MLVLGKLPDLALALPNYVAFILLMTSLNAALINLILKPVQTAIFMCFIREMPKYNTQKRRKR